MSPDQFDKMKVVLILPLLNELKVSNIFMHRLILADFNDRIADMPSACLHNAARCVLSYSIC